jgi:hypothetical protein
VPTGKGPFLLCPSPFVAEDLVVQRQVHGHRRREVNRVPLGQAKGDGGSPWPGAGVRAERPWWEDAVHRETDGHVGLRDRGSAMDDRTGQPLQVQKAIQPIGDELASCLERFLTASADERTMDRAREALTLWYRLTERYSASLA